MRLRAVAVPDFGAGPLRAAELEERVDCERVGEVRVAMLRRVPPGGGGARDQHRAGATRTVTPHGRVSRVKTPVAGAPGRYLEQREQRRTSRFTLTAPIVSLVLVAFAYLVPVTGGWIPEQWVSHVDGQGNATSSGHWPLAAGALGAAALTFVIGWLVSREYVQAGHWHALEKGITVSVLGLAYGFLGVLLATVAGSWGRPASSGPELMGLGLLGFVLAFILAAVFHTIALPPARVDHWTPRY